MTTAMPKIASYEFTTLHPHLGVIKFDDYKDILLEDLPGIIKDAHKNKGLGHKFLKHLERTKLIIYVLDGSNDSNWERNPLSDFKTLQDELREYKKELLEKPFLIVLNKNDINSEIYKLNKSLIQKYITSSNLNTKIIEVSGRNGNNMQELVYAIRNRIEELTNSIKY